MPFRLRRDARQWFRYIYSSFSLDFDLYYLCLMAGLTESRLENTAAADTTELVDNFPGEYRTKGRLIVSLFLSRELRRMAVDYSERAAVHQTINQLVDPLAPSHLSESGLRQINKYAFGGYEVLTEWFPDPPRRVETFLVAYMRKLRSALEASE